MPMWRNWQTRCVQVAVSARTWGFESPLWYQTSLRRPSKEACRGEVADEAGANDHPTSHRPPRHHVYILESLSQPNTLHTVSDHPWTAPLSRGVVPLLVWNLIRKLTCALRCGTHWGGVILTRRRKDTKGELGCLGVSVAPPARRIRPGPFWEERPKTRSWRNPPSRHCRQLPPQKKGERRGIVSFDRAGERQWIAVLFSRGPAGTGDATRQNVLQGPPRSRPLWSAPI